MNKLQSIIYPTTYRQVPIIDLAKIYYPDWKIIPLVPSAYYNSGDISLLDRRDNVGVKAYRNLEPCVFSSHNLFLSCSTGSKSLRDQTREISKMAFENGMQIINLGDEIDLPDDNKVIHYPTAKIKTFCDIDYEEILYESNVPIIGVGSLWGFANQSEISAKIALELKRRGIKATSIVNSNDYCILDFYPMLDILLDDKKTISDKILGVNHYIKYVIDSSKCELLVLEIPGSLMKQSTRILNDFGQYAFLISQAISIDLFVCCSTFTNYGYDVYKLMLEYISSVFGLDITFLHIANSFVLDNPGQKPSLTFKTIDSVTKKISHLRAGLDSDEVMIGNLQNNVDFNACINSILRAFTNESAV